MPATTHRQIKLWLKEFSQKGYFRDKLLQFWDYRPFLNPLVNRFWPMTSCLFQISTHPIFHSDLCMALKVLDPKTGRTLLSIHPLAGPSLNRTVRARWAPDTGCPPQAPPDPSPTTRAPQKSYLTRPGPLMPGVPVVRHVGHSDLALHVCLHYSCVQSRSESKWEQVRAREREFVKCAVWLFCAQ